MANPLYSDQLARVRLMAQGHGPMLSGEEREAIAAVLAERDALAETLRDYMARHAWEVGRVCECPQCLRFRVALASEPLESEAHSG